MHTCGLKPDLTKRYNNLHINNLNRIINNLSHLEIPILRLICCYDRFEIEYLFVDDFRPLINDSTHRETRS